MTKNLYQQTHTRIASNPNSSKRDPTEAEKEIGAKRRRIERRRYKAELQQILYDDWDYV